ncbi:MAG: hypothetical protein P8Z77_09855 [Candidatus Thiodiazotropha sp.]
MKRLVDDDVTLNIDDRYYALSIVPASSDTGIVSADFLLLSDITHVVTQIRKATIKSVLIGLIGFAVSEMLLLLMLRRPLKRLLLISNRTTRCRTRPSA